MSKHIPGKKHPEVIAALTAILADTSVVYYKTHGFHWNVEDSSFYSLHLMLEKFYTTLWNSLDEIAERIRALDEKTPSSYRALLQKASIQEAEGSLPTDIMIKNLRDDYLVLAKKTLEASSFAEKEGDLVTANMMVEKATFLEKAAWMLQSSFISS